jgi:hypothetical protein
MKGLSLRKAIDQHCKQCVYDKMCPGTWRQQTTLCAIEKCPLWPVRPKTSSPIPLSVLSSYGPENRLFQRSVDNGEVGL